MVIQMSIEFRGRQVAFNKGNRNKYHFTLQNKTSKPPKKLLIIVIIIINTQY